MKKNKVFGIIYSAENEVTGEYYIGATRKSVEERQKDHIKKSKTDDRAPFHEAIATYGTDAFNWTEIDTANSVNELAEKEKQYIFEYKSKDKCYNLDNGGGFKKKVFQYDNETGLLVNIYDSLEDASMSIKATPKQISRACLSVNKEFGGYYWSYVYKEPFIPDEDKRVKSIIQIDMSDNTLNEFKSVSEASEVTGINKSSIAKVCRGERKYAGRYKWKYK